MDDCCESCASGGACAGATTGDPELDACLVARAESDTGRSPQPVRGPRPAPAPPPAATRSASSSGFSRRRQDGPGTSDGGLT
jgi:hypothetical protein